MCLLGFFNFEGVESEGSTKLKDSAKTMFFHCLQMKIPGRHTGENTTGGWPIAGRQTTTGKDNDMAKPCGPKEIDNTNHKKK